MIWGRRGEGGALTLGSLTDDDLECPCEPEPKRVFDAILKARLSAFEAAREAMLEGEDERGGAFALGGGGNVILPTAYRVTVQDDIQRVSTYDPARVDEVVQLFLIPQVSETRLTMSG